jgi:hypothetical protein
MAGQRWAVRLMLEDGEQIEIVNYKGERIRHTVMDASKTMRVRYEPLHTEIENELYPDEDGWMSFDGGSYLSDIHRKTALTGDEIADFLTSW